MRYIVSLIWAFVLVVPMCTRNNQHSDEMVDGVRADITQEIKRRFSGNPKAETAAIASAKAFQSILDSAIDPISISDQIDRTDSCLIYYMGGDDSYKLIHFLEKETFNTKEKWAKYAKYNAALSGGVYKSYTPSSSLCEKH